eukprot:Skav200949  [mRNA]  locus=scaffold448:157531:159232:- [translate_table: standard]
MGLPTRPARGPQQLAFYNSSRHASGCGFRPVPCSFESRGCEKRINARDLEQHCESSLAVYEGPQALTRLCPAATCAAGFRLVPCSYAIHGCEAGEPTGGFFPSRSHAEKCAFRPVQCLHAKRGCPEELWLKPSLLGISGIEH